MDLPAERLPAALATKRTNPFYPIGFEELSPRVVLGGPIIKGKWSLLVSAQRRYKSEQVWSRPLSERRDATGGSFFTRLDGKVGARQRSVSATFGVFPNTSTRSDSHNLHASGGHDRRAPAGGHRRSHPNSFQLAPASTLESTVAVGYFRSRSNGQGLARMVVTPDEIRGTFTTNRTAGPEPSSSTRCSRSFEQGPFGAHLFKVGADALQRFRYQEEKNRPIEVRRANGTLAALMTFDRINRRRTSTSDVAAFVQDWWQLNSRVLLERTRVEYNGAFSNSGSENLWGPCIS